MRTVYHVLCIVILLFACTCANAVTIATKGTANATIVIARDASPDERHAAKELKDFLGQVTGGKFRIAYAPEAGKDGIFIGIKAARSADPAFTTEGLGTDGIVIRTIGNNLILAGGAPRGTLYATFTFLEDYVGCHWWSSTASTIPKKATLKFSDLNVRYTPQFEYRTMQYADAQDGNYSVRNKLNGDFQRVFTDDGIHNARENPELGGRRYAFHKWIRWSRGLPCMMIDRHIYLKDHPEWFAALPRNKPAQPYVGGAGPDGLPSMEGGELIRPLTLEDLDKPPFAPPGTEGLCLSNQDMIRECIKNTKLGVIWSPIGTWVDASQPDGDNCCRCDNCMAVAREEGSYAGLTIRFANAVADELVKDPSTSVPVRVMAYHMTRKPPKVVKPRDNVIVTLEVGFSYLPKPGQASDEPSFSRPMADQPFRHDLAGWSRITRRLYIHDYICNHAAPLIPYPNLRVLGPNIKLYADNNATGIYEETFWECPGTELAELRAWVVSKLMWNPNLDGWKLVGEFCRGYYGPAGNNVLAYLNTMHDVMAAGTVSRVTLSPGAGFNEEFLTLHSLSTSWAYLKAAEDAVKDNPELRFRVQVAQLPVMYTFLMRWDELKDKAKSEGAVWPLSDSMSDVVDQLVRVALKKGMTKDVLSAQVYGQRPATAKLDELIIRSLAELDQD